MFTPIKPLIPADKLKSQLPIRANLRREYIKQISAILSGDDRRKLFIVGPCSADDPVAVADYALRLKRVADEVNDDILVVMRVYTAKPRSRGNEYLGLLHMPDTSAGVTDIAAGLAAARKLHLDILCDVGLPTADEIVYPELYAYFDDVLCYATVGARTAEDPQHRFVASGADIPTGIKNPINGNIDELAGCIHTAQTPNEFVYNGNIVGTRGNACVHAILRGAVDINGNNIRNCGHADVMRVAAAFAERGISAGAVIDTGHSNNAKRPELVASTVADVTEGFKRAEYDAFVKGVMVESYIGDGKKRIGQSGYGVSVTDPCLGWEQTERVLLSAAQAIRAARLQS